MSLYASLSEDRIAAVAKAAADFTGPGEVTPAHEQEARRFIAMLAAARAVERAAIAEVTSALIGGTGRGGG